MYQISEYDGVYQRPRTLPEPSLLPLSTTQQYHNRMIRHLLLCAKTKHHNRTSGWNGELYSTRHKNTFSLTSSSKKRRHSDRRRHSSESDSDDDSSSDSSSSSGSSSDEESSKVVNYFVVSCMLVCIIRCGGITPCQGGKEV